MIQDFETGNFAEAVFEKASQYDLEGTPTKEVLAEVRQENTPDSSLRLLQWLLAN